MNDSLVEWVEPSHIPAPPPSRADLVMDELRSRPNTWARIAQNEPLQLLPWWNAIHDSQEFETKFIHKSHEIFGPKDVYARYVGPPDDTNRA